MTREAVRRSREESARINLHKENMPTTSSRSLTPVSASAWVSSHLTCPYCSNQLADPITAVCGHTVCQDCLDNHLHALQCPMCKTDLQIGPTVNFTLNSLLHDVNQQPEPNPDLFTGAPNEVACSNCPEDLKLRAVKSCLVCLLSYCEKHLKRHQTKARLKGHKLVKPVKDLDQRACLTHGRPLELYCRTEKKCICALCVEEGNEVVPVETERDGRQYELRSTKTDLEQKIKQREDEITEILQSVESCQAQIESEEEVIKEVFATVMEAVRRAEEVLLDPLEKRKRQMEEEMKERIQELQNEIRTLENTISHLEYHICEEDDVLFLQNTISVPAIHNDKHQAVSINTELNFGSVWGTEMDLITEIQAELQKLSAIDIKRIKTFAVDVTLDPDTAHPQLEISEDGRRLRDGGVRRDVPNSTDRFDLYGSVLGRNQLSSGRAFWVVEVGRKAGWELGLMREGANRRGKISYKPSEGYWAIVLCGQDMYGAFEDPPVQLQLPTKPQKVGVFVDWEEGLISFYDMDASSHIYTFTKCSFKGVIRPYFNPHPNKDGKNPCPLVISSIKHIV